MRHYLVNGLVTIVTVVACLFLAEGAMRVADGLPATAMVLPETISAHDVDVQYIDSVPRAASVPRDLVFRTPPPLPNRGKAPPEEIELFRRVQKDALIASVERRFAFQPWDLHKVWNTAYVGDPCQHHYFPVSPGRIFVYDPPDGKPHPTFRFPRNATLPSGLVTNDFGWRGPPAPFRREPRTVRIVFLGASTMAEIHNFPFSSPEYIHHWLNLWAAERKLDVRFEVLNAARESIGSTDIAAIVRQEVVPLRPDLVVYYGGGNQFDMASVVKTKPDVPPQPPDWLSGRLRELAHYSALARRVEVLTGGGEWPKPPYRLEFPPGVSESDPDIALPDLPVNLSVILRDLDRIRGDMAAIGGELAVASFHWLPRHGLQLDGAHHRPMLETLNVFYHPYTYADLDRMTAFQNRVYEKYARAHGLPFVDVAKYMPHDPDLFSDPTHNMPAGIRLRAWIMLQQLVPAIEARLASGAWPKPPPEMPDSHPAFTDPPRRITFACKPS